MSATISSSLEVEDALVKVGERLGMKVLLLKMIAADLPDNPWLISLEVEAAGDGVVARTTHLCGRGCVGDASGCLTAYKVEDALTKREGRILRIAEVRREGEEGLVVRLGPLVPATR